MRHSHFFGAFKMTRDFGFLIALAVGLTGIGGGSFTVPLLLFSGLPAAEAVGTTFVFAGVLRLIAAPFTLRRNKFTCATPGCCCAVRCRGLCSAWSL